MTEAAGMAQDPPKMVDKRKEAAAQQAIQKAQREAAERIGKAANSLIDACNAAAVAELKAEKAVGDPTVGSRAMFDIARASRSARDAAMAKVNDYIKVVIETAPRSSQVS